MTVMPGRITLVPTPLGHLQDLSPRSLEALQNVDWILAEDTRVSGKLLQLLGFKKPLRTLNEHTSPQAIEKYIQEIQESGDHVAVITDAGTPGISDPGAMFVDQCSQTDIEIHAVPGPSAVTLALSLSGFFAQRFAFLGYLPRKPGPFKAELEPFVDSPITLVFFESPYRIDDFLAQSHEVLGDRRVVICRELTKMYEQVVRSTLAIRPSEQEMPRRGEFTVVIEGKRKRREVRDETW